MKDLCKQRIAEVKFLRAHFYYKLLTVFRQVPWIDEVAYSNNTIEQIRNDQFTYQELFGKIIADFETAYNVLPDEQANGGRVNKIAAAAYLAKVLFELGMGRRL